MSLSVTLTIGGTDVTAYAHLETVRPTESLRDRAGTMAGLRLTIPYSGTVPAVAVPRAGQEVVLEVAGTREFAGVVQRVRETPAGSRSYAYEVDCADYVRWLDRHLVQGVTLPAGAAGTTGAVGDVVTTLISSYANAGAITWDVSLVESGPVIPQVVFDFEPVSGCLDRLAKQTGYRWWVDYDRRVVFAAIDAPAMAAPVPTVAWESGTVLHDLVLEEAGDQIVTVAYIKDARAVATNDDGSAKPYTDVRGAGDGYQTFFGLGYEPSDYANTTVTVTPTSGPATTYTVGNAGLLQENQDGTPGDGLATDKALLCLPNWGVRFQVPPPAGARVTATYRYLDIGPAVWAVRDASSITEVRGREGSANSDGVYEEVFSAADLEGVSSDAIRARAELYLSQRAHVWVGTARVYGAGWRSGQYLTVTSDRRFGGAFTAGVRLYVTEVSKRFATPDAWVNDLALSSNLYGEV